MAGFASDTTHRNHRPVVAAAPKVRIKGACTGIQKLFEEEALPTSAAGRNLFCWAASRRFDGHECFGILPAMSNRTYLCVSGKS
ncbi:DUF1403 family protein [Martelella soudanensis]|uniref:DUF1403 family protein n=1 Tax=unclassified Martelella TaxID=2629616 RepID=UPI0015DDA053|nr:MULTISPECIES: DUF1403 family protein [unclassified Martelella]